MCGRCNMIEVGDLVRLHQEARRSWLTNLWIVINLHDIFDGNGEVTKFASLHNGQQICTRRIELLEKI